ncbi:MAG TPA: valine--tRNA ligase [Candidatus Kapabacteria bacterium]|nr:valine--tRNA ligase [Candidatus Kapabacteria bacterium]
MPELAKTYSPNEIEQKWYEYWEKSGFFKAQRDPAKKPFVIVMPPPNVTGSLTLGHVLNHTIQDVYTRWHRMKGDEACWVPGMDHAGIATQAVVEKRLLAEEKLTRHDLGREKFVERVWEWKKNYGGLIGKQLRRLGISCDWDREKFTLDDDLSAAVREAFVRLYEKGLIYRGKRIINWDPKLLTALSDEEVEHKTRNGKLWHFKYPIIGADGKPSTKDFIIVATTRPETMLGDTAVAVNPKDERYKNLVGKKVLLPLMNREIPIIADDYVDSSFGTGAVKVTPAHDPNDFEMGQRHNLPTINIMHPNAVLNENAGAYAGLDRFAARKKVVADMEAAGFVSKIEDYTNSVGYSQRSDEVIEPYLSDQWFVKMKPLAEKALKVVLDGEIKFHPEHWVKTYDHWMTNVRDWCISRQLWWGHRIPVWYCVGDDECKLECKQPIVSRTTPEKCPHCGSKNLRQDEDVLDTWFSSWLWPISVFGWPNETDDLQYFYPTNLLSTGPDIIFFWVARMIVAGLEFKCKVPFRDVYFHNIIRDGEGRKLSKSLGNSPDPITVMDQYGTDALRFSILYIAPMGQDVLFDVEKCEIGRNFANKIWNAARFLMMKKAECEATLGNPMFQTHVLKDEAKELADWWIEGRFHAKAYELNGAIETFNVNFYSKSIYSFIWNEFCDSYVEIVKNRIAKSSDTGKNMALCNFAIGIFEQALCYLHPVMPFITEEIWQTLRVRKEGETIMRQPLEESIMGIMSNDNLLRRQEYFTKTGWEMDYIIDSVERIRQMRKENNIPPAKALEAFVRLPQAVHDERFRFINPEWIETHKSYIEDICRVTLTITDSDNSLPKVRSSSVVHETEIFLSLEGLIDVEKERDRLTKEIARLTGQTEATKKKLENPSFADRAPKDVVEKERAKLASFADAIKKLEESLAALK